MGLAGDGDVDCRVGGGWRFCEVVWGVGWDVLGRGSRFGGGLVAVVGGSLVGILGHGRGLGGMEVDSWGKGLGMGGMGSRRVGRAACVVGMGAVRVA